MRVVAKIERRTDVEGNLELGEEQHSVTPGSQARQHQLEERELGRRLGHPLVSLDRVDAAVLELRLDEVRMLARLSELHHQVVERSQLRLPRLLGLELGRRLGRQLLNHRRVSQHERLVLLLLQLGQTDRQDDLVLQEQGREGSRQSGSEVERCKTRSLGPTFGGSLSTSALIRRRKLGRKASVEVDQSCEALNRRVGDAH